MGEGAAMRGQNGHSRKGRVVRGWVLGVGAVEGSWRWMPGAGMVLGDEGVTQTVLVRVPWEAAGGGCWRWTGVGGGF